MRTILTGAVLLLVVLTLAGLAGLAALAMAARSAFAETPAPTLAPPALLDALRGGGYVIYFRHALTDRTQADVDLTRCDRQRNLDARGRADAAAIGEAFRRFEIPVDTVYGSNYCRTQDTARLAFGRVEVVPGLASADARLKGLLSTAPPPGENTVVVAHGFIITRVAGITIAEGEAVVFQPLGPAGFRLVARLLPAEWADLAPSVR